VFDLDGSGSISRVWNRSPVHFVLSFTPAKSFKVEMSGMGGLGGVAHMWWGASPIFEYELNHHENLFMSFHQRSIL
jgi:hypothetical protein